MTWSDWLAALPFFRTRKALADATRTLVARIEETRFESECEGSVEEPSGAVECRPGVIEV